MPNDPSISDERFVFSIEFAWSMCASDALHSNRFEKNHLCFDVKEKQKKDHVGLVSNGCVFPSRGWWLHKLSRLTGTSYPFHSSPSETLSKNCLFFLEYLRLLSITTLILVKTESEIGSSRTGWDVFHPWERAPFTRKSQLAIWHRRIVHRKINESMSFRIFAVVERYVMLRKKNWKETRGMTS